MENISVRPPLNGALKRMQAEYRAQSEKGTAPLNPACYLLDKRHLTDSAIDRAVSGEKISSSDKYYGKINTDLEGFELEDASQLYMMMSAGKNGIVHTRPIEEKKGGGPIYQWEVSIKFDDLIPFSGPGEGEKGIGEHDLNLLNGSLLPYVDVQEGNGHITFDSLDPVTNEVSLRFEGSASAARNLEKYARVWNGGCEDYSVDLTGIKPNFFTALPTALLRRHESK